MSRVTYLQILPSPALQPFLRSLWYCQAPEIDHKQERVLPNGCIQIVLNLARNYLIDGHGGRLAPAIIVGASGQYEIIDTEDLTELAGIVIKPGGFTGLFHEPADLFFEQSVALDSLWPGFACTQQLSEARSPVEKLNRLDALLQKRVVPRLCRSTLVIEALHSFSNPNMSVSECARSAGVSERRLSQVFREQVGLCPKLWCRIQRFQRALRGLHRGADIPWAELALRCGYYDQSHFINDFRSFSGINPTTYSLGRGQWRNHVPLI